MNQKERMHSALYWIVVAFLTATVGLLAWGGYYVSIHRALAPARPDSMSRSAGGSLTANLRVYSSAIPPNAITAPAIESKANGSILIQLALQLGEAELRWLARERSAAPPAGEVVFATGQSARRVQGDLYEFELSGAVFYSGAAIYLAAFDAASELIFEAELDIAPTMPALPNGHS